MKQNDLMIIFIDFSRSITNDAHIQKSLSDYVT